MRPSDGRPAERDAASPRRRSPPPASVAARFLANIETVVHGKHDEITLVLAALACQGHVLLEDVPGTAKTVLARAIAQSIDGASQARIQCTPDLQPTDVTGLAVFDQKEREFEFRPGPIFANVVLVDEINRAMPKTQSALLEAMAERQVTVDGVTRRLPDPFLLLATENPIEHEGTFPLPEAQLDRFFLQGVARLPGHRERAADHPRPARRAPARRGSSRSSRSTRSATLQDAVEDVYVDALIERWIVDLVERDARRSTRSRSAPRCAAASRSSGPRARGRCSPGASYVVPGDVDGSSCRCSGTGSRSRRRCSPRRAGSAPGRGARRASASGCSPRAPPPRARRARRRSPRPRLEPGGRAVFPLVPTPRLVGLAFGAMRERRAAARGSDVAGLAAVPSRATTSQAIDWNASARLSSARGSDEFVVRERFAEEAPRVVVVCDRRPEMALFPAGLPWLSKPAAVRAVVELVVESTLAARGLVRLPRPRRAASRSGGRRAAQADAWEVERAARRRRRSTRRPDNARRARSSSPRRRAALCRPGSFVFVLSDFLGPPPREAWTRALEQRWDVVPVVIQDPVWEQSFPAIAGSSSRCSTRRGRHACGSVRLRAREAARAARREPSAGASDAARRASARSGSTPILVSVRRPRARVPRVPRLGRRAPATRVGHGW